MFNMEFVAKYDSSKCYGTNYDKLDGDYYLAFKDPNNSDKISILGIRKMVICIILLLIYDLMNLL